MPTLKEAKTKLREFLGIGEKNYETTSINKIKHGTATIAVISVVENEEDVKKIKKTIESQTYQTILLILVSENHKNFSLEWEDVLTVKTKGNHYYDGVKELEGLSSIDYFILLDPKSDWSSGHLESLLRATKGGVPYAERVFIDPGVGWDISKAFLGPITAEQILWGLEHRRFWEGRNNEEAVRNIKRSKIPLISTNMHTLAVIDKRA